MADSDKERALYLQIARDHDAINDLKQRIADLEDRASRFSGLAPLINENKEVLQEVKESKIAWRLVRRALIWLGAAAGAISAIVVLWSQLFHGGKLPFSG
jgi:hypothetical protein